MRQPRTRGALALLRLPELAYTAAVRVRNRLFDAHLVTLGAGVPVISVGNITVGGTGKTPLVAWLATRLREAGMLPAVVSRGYAGRAGRGPLVVSDGRGPLVGPDWSGDEPFLLARMLPGVPVVVGADRPAAARRARDMGAEVVLLDDGFQHRRLRRDLDLVLLDAGSPIGNGHLLPAGILREPPSSLARADAVVVTRCAPEGPPHALIDFVRRHRPGAPVIGATHRRDGWVDARGAAACAPDRAVAFCGIAVPEGFHADLRAEGVEILSGRSFPDHHRYAEHDLRALAELARRAGATLVTTEKDIVRLPPAALLAPPPHRRWTRRDDPGSSEPPPAQAPTLWGVPVVALRIAAEVLDPAALLTLVHAAIGRAHP